jgi:hypothetical protein
VISAPIPRPTFLSLPSKTPGVKGKPLIYMSFLQASSGGFAGLGRPGEAGIGKKRPKNAKAGGFFARRPSFRS